jgi:hypothetical protein
LQTARLVFGMNQSLDRYVDHTAFAPSPMLFRHFIEEARHQTGKWEAAEQAFAQAWRKQPKWVGQADLRSCLDPSPAARLRAHQASS